MKNKIGVLVGICSTLIYTYINWNHNVVDPFDYIRLLLQAFASYNLIAVVFVTIIALFYKSAEEKWGYLYGIFTLIFLLIHYLIKLNF